MFYTYVWRDALGIPFYVGKGAGKRAYNTKNRPAAFKKIYDSGNCAVEIVDEFIHEAQAHALEVELIAKYRRREFGGLLINKTDGGEGQSGAVVSVATREHMRAVMTGRTFHESSLAKMSDYASNRTPEHQAKLTAAIHARSPDVYAKTAAANRGRKNTPESNARISAGRSGILHTEATKAKLSAANLGRKHSDETRAKMSANNAMLNPENRAKVSAGLKGRIASPQTRERISLAQRMKPPRVGFKGVFASRKRWAARIQGAIRTQVGTFDTPELAARAYDKAAYQAWGDQCYLNFPNDLSGAIAA